MTILHGGGKSLGEEFLDFLTILSSFEYSGLKMMDLFEQAAQGRVVLPEAFTRLSRLYVFLEKASGDPYTSLKNLSSTVSSTQVSKFLREYGEVLVSSGNTQALVERYLEEELEKHRARISSLVSQLDAFYEGFLIMILSVTVLAVIPGGFVNPLASAVSIAGAGLVGYWIASRISDALLAPRTAPGVAGDLAVIALSPVVFTGIPGVFIHFSTALILYLLLRERVRRVVLEEAEAVFTAGEVAASLALGTPVDASSVQRLRSSSILAYRALGLALLNGFNASRILASTSLPRLSRKALSLLLAPVEYTGLAAPLASSVGRLLRHVAEARKWCLERSRVYFFYAVFTVAVMFLTALLIESSALSFRLPRETVASILYASVSASITVASVVESGGLFYSGRNVAVLLGLGLLVYFSPTIL
ncbi:MAG: hypothetical protein QXL34_06480 [Thermosphaera sp.]